MGWEIIDGHRKKAREVAFNILVWGPSKQDKVDFGLRKCIQNYLKSKGHSAKFSEELIDEGLVSAAPNKIIDEIFHADAANLIVVLYGSRGTQTEVDVILEFEEFARKSIILVKEDTWKRIRYSLSCDKWQTFGAKVVVIPKKLWTGEDLCKKLDDVVVEFQFAEYLRDLKLRLLQNA